MTKQIKKRYNEIKVDEKHRKPKRPTVIYLQTGDLDITVMQGADLVEVTDNQRKLSETASMKLVPSGTTFKGFVV